MSREVGNLFPDFPEEPYQAPLTLAFMTDTQVPQTIVPVFFIHDMERPFCDDPRCPCQQQRAQKTALFINIQRGDMILRREGEAKE